MKKGIFTISLDFELHWGVFSSQSIQDYQTNLQGTTKAIKGILDLFTKTGIHATWATVGFLFCKNAKEAVQWLPNPMPTYADKTFDPYPILARESSQTNAAYYFAPAMIEQIQQTPYQEIASHTFSHFYCLEKGQKPAQFQADIERAIQIAQQKGIQLQSIVFPRNQYKSTYTNILKKLNINYLRTNSSHFLYRERTKQSEKKLWVRALRLLDTYINLSGHQIHLPIQKVGIVSLPASRMLRPFIPKLKWLESLKVRRIKKEMTAAAEQGKHYHLWWHPHNFGANTNENLANLTAILQHYQSLNKQYGFQSLNMQEVGQSFNKKSIKSKRLILL